MTDADIHAGGEAEVRACLDDVRPEPPGNASYFVALRPVVDHDHLVCLAYNGIQALAQPVARAMRDDDYRRRHRARRHQMPEDRLTRMSVVPDGQVTARMPDSNPPVAAIREHQSP